MGLWMIVVVMPNEKTDEDHRPLAAKASRDANRMTSYQQSESGSGSARQDRVPSRMVSYQSEASSGRRRG